LVRPRDERWLVLLAFYWVTAIFLAAGAVSMSNQAFSVTVAHVAVAFFMPLVVHLHLVLPRRNFPTLRRTLLPMLWAIAVSLAVVDVTVGYPSLVMGLLFITGLGLSMVIFVARLRRPSPPPVRAAQRLILAGLVLGLLPTLTVIFVVTSLDSVNPLPFDSNRLLISSLAMILLPNWPLSYLYAIHKLDLGKIELRANRALGGYGFWSLYITLYIALFLTIAAHWPFVRDQPVVTSLCLSLLFVGTTPWFRRSFQRSIDRHVLGLFHTPDEVVDLFASRIPKALEGENLGRILERDILPTLLVRESALLLVTDDGRTLDPVHIFGVRPERLPADITGVDRLMIAAAEGRARVVPQGAMAPPLDWVRLVLPLVGRDQGLGAWLLGRRDPDDHYPSDDVRLLSNLANQIGSVLRVRRELAENRRLQDQLVQSQKMEAIGRLSAGVAHDFNNLLSAILGYSDLLLDASTQRPLERNAYVQGIKEAGEKAAALTGQLLAFSRQQVMAARIVDLNQVVLDLESLLRRVLEEDIELSCDLAAELSTVRIDPGQMEQVLLNLVVNASDAMTGRGGVLTLSTLEVVCGGASSPCPPEMAPGPWVVLRVSDTGAGIPAQVVDRIFEPF
ncbi:MAG: histidine kinase dimerization/phospho-acceptor domain-containing protein, partial [Acidobacteriota bacterium]